MTEANFRTFFSKTLSTKIPENHDLLQYCLFYILLTRLRQQKNYDSKLPVPMLKQYLVSQLYANYSINNYFVNSFIHSFIHS